MTNPWQLYDDLIDAVPADIRVVDALVSRFALVRTDAGATGLALADRAGRREPPPEAVIGAPLRSVAALVKSWDFQQAALGVAALNAFFNTEVRVHAFRDALIGADEDVFTLLAPLLPGRKVGVIGHFAGLPRLAAARELVVLERDPSGDDLPDPAAEYELPSCDLVIITGTTVANKTLPRLLSLASNARVVLVGPTTPFAPEVYGDRVAQLATARVCEPGRCADLVRLGASMRTVKQTLTRFNAVFDRPLTAVEGR